MAYIECVSSASATKAWWNMEISMSHIQFDLWTEHISQYNARWFMQNRTSCTKYISIGKNESEQAQNRSRHTYRTRECRLQLGMFFNDIRCFPLISYRSIIWEWWAPNMRRYNDAWIAFPWELCISVSVCAAVFSASIGFAALHWACNDARWQNVSVA